MTSQTPSPNPAAQETLEFWERQTLLLGGRDPLQVLSETSPVLGHLIQDLPVSVLTAHPLQNKWSIQEIILHLADMEWVFGFRIRTILGDEEPLLIPVDQASWSVRLAAEGRDTSSGLKAFSSLRELNLEYWRSLGEDELQRCGLHQDTGVQLSLERIRVIQAGHDLSHLAQIEERLGLLKS